MIYEAIKKLVQYGLDTGLITEVDKIYATNQILDVMRMDEYEEPEGEQGETDLESVLKELLDYAHETELCRRTALHTVIYSIQN